MATMSQPVQLRGLSITQFASEGYKRNWMRGPDGTPQGLGVGIGIQRVVIGVAGSDSRRRQIPDKLKFQRMLWCH